MAEIAIPLLALGTMWIAFAKKNKSSIKEPFIPEKKSFASEIPKNYPITLPVSDTNPKKYHGYQWTDKYYNKSVGQRVLANNPPDSAGHCTQIPLSLTGKPIDTSTFDHNNMVPFFGARVRGATLNANSAESRLDNLQGAGSQTISKTEQAPLFQPHKNLQYANGAPNVSEFMLSRVNPSTRVANVKPWEELKIPPGLNKGYTSEPGSGFNAGLDARDKWLPKTVNELRVATNPKLTFGLEGLQGPAHAPVTEAATMATQGRMEKNLPDTYYDVGPSRWFTTKGLETAPTARGVEVLQDVNRPSTSCPYFGSGKDGDATYVSGHYENAKRPELCPNAITNLSAAGKREAHPEDYGIKGYNPRNNHRSSTTQPDNYGGIQGMVKAIVAPVLDILRPTRKENVVGNVRPNGNINTTAPLGYIYNPADRTKTTIKETTEGKLDCNHLNIENQIGNAYLISEQQASQVQRDSTNCSYLGSGDTAATGSSARLYDSAYRQRNNPNKSYPNRPNQGGTQIFNQNTNMCMSRQDEDRCNNRLWAPSGGPSMVPSKYTYGKINVPQYYDETKIGKDRIDPNLLTAFKSNPYTQSLNSWA